MSRALAFAKIAGLSALGVAIGCPAAGVGLGAAALTFAASLSVEAAGQHLTAAFKKEKSGRDWLQNGHLSELICLTLASIIETEMDTEPSRKAVKQLKNLKPEHLALIAQDVTEVDTAVLPHLYLKTPEQLRTEPAGEIDDWKSILRFAFSDWNGRSLQCEIQEPGLTNLAETIQRKYLNALLDVAVAHPEHSRKLVFKILSAGFATGERTLQKVQELLDRQVPLFSRPEATHYGSEFDFNNELVVFRGRDAEIERVGKFLEGDGFKWWRLTGNGGAGKSRFALHLVDLARLGGWTSGFVGTLTEETYQEFAKWVPEHDTFLVFDYAVDYPAQAKKFLNYLATNAGIKSSGKRVRALLLARESTPLRWQRIVSASTADAALINSLYTETLRPERGDPFNDPGTQIALADLTADDLLKVSEECWRALEFQTKFPFDQARKMIDNLESMSLANLPLYVQFATVALEKGEMKFAERHDIVEVVVKRQVDKWLAARLSPAELDLALYASIVGGVTVTEANQKNPHLFPATMEASNIAGLNGMQRDFAGQTARDWVAPLSPNLIAEWYVLSRLRDSRTELDTGAKARAEDVWKAAHTHANFVRFLFRISNSFGNLTDKSVIQSSLEDQSCVFRFALELAHSFVRDEDISPAAIVDFLTVVEHSDRETQPSLVGVAFGIILRYSGDIGPLMTWLGQSAESEYPEVRASYAGNLAHTIRANCWTADQVQAHLKFLKGMEGRNQNLELQLAYATGLSNAIWPGISTSGQVMEHLRALREIQEGVSNRWLKLKYAMGLVNAVWPGLSTSEQVTEHLRALATLEAGNEDPLLKLQFAQGLLRAISQGFSTRDQVQGRVKALKEIDGRNKNAELQLLYANGLFNAIKPELSTKEQVQEHIKALRGIEGRNENPELQLRYAQGLVNAIRPELSTKEQVQEHIKALREIEGRNENPELQIEYAKGLVNAIVNFPELRATSFAELQELCALSDNLDILECGLVGKLLMCLLEGVRRDEAVQEVRAVMHGLPQTRQKLLGLTRQVLGALHQKYQFTPDEIPELFG